jgi:hypothetical protein
MFKTQQMKKLILIAMVTIGLSQSSFSQSDLSMLEKVKSLHPNNRISTKLDSKGYTEKKWEKGAWVYYYCRGYTVISKTEYSGITHKYTGSLQYKSLDNSNFIYDLNMVGDGEYLGVPSPDKSQIIKLLKSDIKNLLGDYHYQSIVGSIPEITLIQESKWRWPKLTMLELRVKSQFTEKISAYKTETSEHIFNVTLYSDNYKRKWNRFVARDLEGETKHLSTKEYNYEELNKLKTLSELDIEKQATEKISGMPQIDLPIFTKDLDLYALTHNVIMTKDISTIKAYLYKVMAKSCKEDGSDVVLTYLTQQWFDKITNNLAVYRKTHFIKPKVKHYQAGLIQFFDKENKRAIDMEGIQEDGTWKIYSIRYYPAREDAIGRMEKM